MIQTRLPNQLGPIVKLVQDSLAQRGVQHRNMTLAGSLEVSRPASEGDENPDEDDRDTLFTIDYLEDVRAIEMREVPVIRPVQSGFRYFLDATQKTVHVMRIGLVPVIATYAVAGVLERDPDGSSHLVPGSLETRFNWIIPKRSGNPDINILVDLLEELHENHDIVRDPIEPNEFPNPYYEQIRGDYSRIVELANKAANDSRAILERDALRKFIANPEKNYPGDWIVVDGKLRENTPNCVGIVKRIMRQNLNGIDAETVFELKPGERSTAFRLLDRHRSADEQTGRTHWYLRMWNADGFEPDRALIHVEAAHDIEHPEAIDEISSWIYAERLPRATADMRWPTLLYPIHVLERILKRRQATFTAGWPSQ